MIGMPITFNIETQGAPDAMGVPTITMTQKTIDDCLIAPITTPTNAREQLAIEQGKVQVEIHIPKGDTTDLSGSSIVYQGKIFQIDTDNVAYMEANTPTRWNRRLRGELVEV